MRGGNVTLTGNQLSWLAGILEGEASFMAGTPLRPRKPSVQVIMTDLDVIQRVADMFGVRISINRPKSERFKPRHGTVLVGGSAVSMMKLIRSLMRERRQAQIDKALACYERLLTFPHRVFRLVDDEIEENDRYWLAGYLEGEGYFSLRTYRDRRIKFRPQVEVESTDLDVIERVQELWLARYSIGTKVYSHKQSLKNAKIAYRITAQNDSARRIMQDLYPLMGERRQTKIRQILAEES
jgi:hypothetical protein